MVGMIVVEQKRSAQVLLGIANLHLGGITCCVLAERDGDRGQRPGGLLHHAPQQNARQAAGKLLGHDAQAQGPFTLHTLQLAAWRSG